MSFALAFTSCYTLSSHQTGKTLGKNVSSIQVIGGVSDFPNLDDRQNRGDRNFIFPKAQILWGVTDHLDLGAILGAGQFGVMTKLQILGRKGSRFALSSGLNANFYSDAILYSGREMYFFDLPLYISYDLTNYLTFYTTPTMSFFKGRDYSDFLFSYERRFEYFTTGLVNGFMIKLSENINCSLEVAWQSELNSNQYTFSTTTGISVNLDWDNILRKKLK